MRTMRILALVAVGTALVTSGPVQATTLVGTQVTGALYFVGYGQNFFDPANGRVPPGYLNVAGTTVTIATNAVEFGFGDGTDTITADFTGAQLIVTDTPSLAGHYNAIQMVFANSAFSSLSAVSDEFPSGGMSGSLSGGVLTLNWAGGNVTSGESLQAVFTVNAPTAPTLSIQFTSANTVVVSWPGPSTDFHLQQNSDLKSTNWVNVATTVVNGQNQLVVSPPVGTRFYRLKYP
jgi:hypothetical protein